MSSTRCGAALRCEQQVSELLLLLIVLFVVLDSSVQKGKFICPSWKTLGFGYKAKFCLFFETKKKST
jgi:hypothetical protein